ncbi:MAG: hypothetical protein K1000chlam3_01274 [Chlamydiae bacterium]|nr:hypothetical protein [Chlamydiota bacterium]
MKITNVLNNQSFIQYGSIGTVLSIAAIIMYCAWKYFSQQSTQAATHNGGGVLPYCVQNNEVYFLLSKEGYGRAKNTWCDFGGGKNKEETVIQTAAREGWEESRDILDDKETIQGKISLASSIGLKKYKMFFMKIENPSTITNKEFTKRKFSKHCRMEKTKIAWVKADDVFKAVQNGNRIQIDGIFFKDKLRGFFAKTIHDALQNPQERAILQKICHIKTLPLQPSLLAI